MSDYCDCIFVRRPTLPPLSPPFSPPPLQVFSALSKAHHLVDEESDELFWELCHWPVDLNVELDEVKTRLTRFRNR